MKAFFQHLITRALLLSLTIFNGAYGAEFQKDTFLRDTEIEETLKLYIEPIMRAAGLDPKRLRLFLVANNAINAAASMDHMIFIHTGLIAKAKSPEEIIGVLAHEVGHIASGHLAQRESHAKKASLMALAAAALGAAAMIGGSPEAGMGLMYGGMSSAQGVYLHYGRGQEAAADQAALSYLEKLHWSSQGLRDFLKKLSKQELLSTNRQESYMLTHPLSSERVELLSRAVDASPYTQTHLPTEYYERFDRMVAKVKGYMEPAGTVLLTYKSTDPSPAAAYARAIAAYRIKKYDQSIAQLKKLTALYPNDPYYQELLGQVLFESGNTQEAIKSYNQALALKPNAPLIQLIRIQAELEYTQTPDLDRIINEIHKILRVERENSFAWENLAKAYGMQNKTGSMALALAEKALTQDDEVGAKEQARRALALLTRGPEKQRAQDIVNEVHRIENAG